MKIFILAAGNADRWGGAVKHLVTVRDRPLIIRTMKMLKEQDAVIITHRKEIIKRSHHCIEPDNHVKLLNTILSSKSMWTDCEEICFLMGDVVFTRNALNKVLEPTNKSFQFYGSLDEHFAFRFTKEEYDHLTTACEDILSKGLEATSWELYRYLCGIPLDKDWTEKWFRTLILDKTDDIDYPSDYEKKTASQYYNSEEFDL